MLVKWSAGLSERQEGVAFFGRAGTAILKSVQRLGIDPLLLYGTLCLKCARLDPAEALSLCLPWLSREIHIVQPKLIVPMGEEVVEALAALDFPLAEPLRAAPGEVQRWTPDHRGALRAGHRRLARRAGRQACLLGGLPGDRRLAPGPAALLIRPSARAAWSRSRTPLKALVALAIGWALARLVSTPRQLVALGLIAAVVDVVSVAAGPSRSIVEDGSDSFERIALHLPPWDTQALLGPVDIVFLGLFVAGAARVGLRTAATAVAVTTGLVIAVGAALGTDAGLPAIPFMAAGLIVVNLDRLRARAG